MSQRKFDSSVVLKIESILFALTDGTYDEATRTAQPTHAVTVTDIRAELYRRYDITQSTDKIRSILHAQDPSGNVYAGEESKAAKIGRLTGASLWCINPSNRPNGKRRYFVVRDLGKSQVMSLLQLIRSTPNGENTDDIALALTNMLCEFDQEELSTEPSKTNPFEI
ncbi:hypothetical protein ET524_09730 [Senegalimassilia faecalis]|uniref:Uncharacterized protein n=1 Tax=Senegalimassilia faecalis TaxID=2509433 RepID=A0A4Q2K307_9ACTN|nr:hypothetical protein [Senegalimassilia faecalis]RXZ54730.1 hypothetical protein ET524_09730 [Senegalimassilia faecalis]